MRELEVEVLSSFLSYPHTIDEFLEKIPKECFEKEAKKALEVMLRLNESKSLSKNTFLQNLSAEDKNNDFFIDILGGIPNANVSHLAFAFHNAFLSKKQAQAGLKLLEASDNGVLLDISTLMPNLSFNDFKSFAQWQDHYATKPQMPKFKTGISFLDSVFDGGIECAQLVLISGDPEAGKTTLGLQILEFMARSNKVCFFSFEFPIYQYLKRKENDKSLKRENLIIIDDGYEIYQVAQNIKSLYKQGVRVFLIDSQMRLVSPNGRNMEEEESLKFSTLARLCHSLGIIVFLIVQTSKGDRDNPMGSKKGGHESSITIRIEHDKPENAAIREFSENSRLIILKKNKQTGKHYKERVSFDSAKGKFGLSEYEQSYKNLEVVEI